ncbi:MAG: DUF3857 domain-containing protein [Sediminibacterium sp.]
MKKFLSIFFLFLCADTSAQIYNVQLIPDSLIKNAHVVKRMEELHVTIKALNKVVITNKYALTILDEQGEYESGYINSYSSMRGLNSIEGNLYDANGKKIKSVKKKDIIDAPSSDGASLMLDERFKKHNFFWRQYPYTIEYSDEMEINNSYFLPVWTPIESDHYSVQQSKFIVETAPDYQLRIKQQNFNQAPQIINGKTINYSWEFKNGIAIEREPLQPAMKEILPMIYIGASDFSIDNYTGDMRSWLSLGKLNTILNKGRDELPDNIKQVVHQLVDTISNKEEKVKKLYQYLQNNTRYISVQLGIGGWQPFDAKYVAANKYGDCKALSNYMVSLLKEAGIKAHYVVIKSGDGEIGLREDFPSPSYFDHVIACVPNGKDSIWLECTSQNNAAGYMGTFTGNRKAFLINDDGGYIVQTPELKARDNFQTRTTKAVVNADGSMTAEVYTHLTGEQQELQHQLIHDFTKEEREKYLNTVLNLATYQVDESKYTEIPGRIPAVDEYLHIQSPNYASVTGKRIFILPNFVNQSKTRLTIDEQRKYPIRFKMAFQDIDTIKIEVPSNYQLESLPKSVAIHNQFGDFEMNFSVINNQIEVTRTQKRNIAEYPAKEYSELVRYFDQIYKADHNSIVFVKKGA